MKPTTFLAKLGGIVLTGVTTLAVALGGLLFAPTAPAYADTGTPPPPERGARIDERLARLYQREQNGLKAQADNLARANDNLAQAQAQIEELKAKGKDTTALVAALATLKEQVAAAQATHDRAARILAAHAGFGEDGKVTDREQARRTLRDAGDSLVDANLALRQAHLIFLRAMRDWRRANRPAL